MNQKQDKKNCRFFIVPVIGAAIGSVIGCWAAYVFLVKPNTATWGWLVIGVYVALAVLFVVGLFSGTIVAYLAYRFGNVKSTFLPGLIGGFLGPIIYWLLFWFVADPRAPIHRYLH